MPMYEVCVKADIYTSVFALSKEEAMAKVEEDVQCCSDAEHVRINSVEAARHKKRKKR